MKKLLAVSVVVLCAAALTAAAQSVVPPPGPAAVVEPSLTQRVQSFQDEYFKKNKKYLQILPGRLAPADSEKLATSTLEQMRREVSPEARVDVYESPYGHGYQMSYTENGTFYSIGYGPEAAQRTYSRLVGGAVATSTSISNTATSTNATSTETSSIL